MRVEWIHPSWRDLVIDELAADAAARLRFLRHADVEGLLLALSVGGGADGSRALPLLRADADFDLATDRLDALLRGCDVQIAGRVLSALAEALPVVTGRALVETDALARRLIQTTRKGWVAAGQVLPLATLEAWLLVAHHTGATGRAPILATWAALDPADAAGDPLRAADWLALATALHRWRRGELIELGFPDRYRFQLAELREGTTVDEPIWREIAQRLHQLGLIDRIPPVAPAPPEPAPPARAQAVATELEPPARTIVDRILDDL